jgi:hypothetical protein
MTELTTAGPAAARTAMPTPNQHVRLHQALLREVNERIRASAALDTSLFVCECSDQDCFGTLQMSLEEYGRIRSNPTWFILTPDHANGAAKQVVKQDADFIVVEG